MAIYQSPIYKPPDEPDLPEGYIGKEFPEQIRPRVWETPMKGIVPLREEIPVSPSTVKTIVRPERTDYSDFQIEFTKELDAMEAMSSAMLMADKGNAAGDPDLTAYATTKHRLRSQEILGYKRQTESSLDIIFQKLWLSNREKWSIFEQARAKIRKPLATPGEVPAIEPEPEKTTFTPAHIQRTLGELATNPELDDRDLLIAFVSERFGFDFARKYPEAVDIINKREQNDFAPLTPEGMPAEITETKPKKTWGWPTLTKPAFRVRPEQPAAIKPLAQMQSAPDMKLDAFWPQLTSEQKRKVWAAFNNGYSVDEIIAGLGAK